MPLTVQEAFAAAELKPAGAVQWGTRPPDSEARPGVYVVSLSADPPARGKALRACPASPAALERLLAMRPELLLDSQRPSAVELQRRIASFWMPDETIVYIGLAGGSLRERVGAYYKTPARSAQSARGRLVLEDAHDPRFPVRPLRAVRRGTRCRAGNARCFRGFCLKCHPQLPP